MPLLQVIVTLIVVGVLLWLVTRFIPMASSIKSILNVVVVIAVVLWLLSIFARLSFLSGIRVITATRSHDPGESCALDRRSSVLSALKFRLTGG
jgi:hypothetical protein